MDSSNLIFNTWENSSNHWNATIGDEGSIDAYSFAVLIIMLQEAPYYILNLNNVFNLWTALIPVAGNLVIKAMTVMVTKKMKIRTLELEIEILKIKLYRKTRIYLPVFFNENPMYQLISVDLDACNTITDLINYVKPLFDVKDEDTIHITHPQYRFLYKGSAFVLKNLRNVRITVHRYNNQSL